jgi:uncharacterized protein with von Willebrand factor type A (vWA) domain
MRRRAQTMHTLFGISPGSEGSLDLQRRIALAETWAKQPQLQALLELVGVLRRDMCSKRQQRTKNVNIEPVGITTGRTIERMLPHELAQAYMPQLRPLWINNYSRRSLLEYEMQGEQRGGRGPIIFLKDGSGSMEDGGRIEWASALQLAVLSIAQREHRAFAGIEFAAEGQYRAWEFPADKPADQELVLSMASHFYMGAGTSIWQGLKAAKDILDSAKPFATADVILCTDGDCAFAEADRLLVRELRNKDVRIHGISLFAPDGRYLSAACDWRCDVTDLAGSNKATNRLAAELT